MPAAQHLIYPDWPACPADLVPQPRVEGPKLKPFDFGGPQQIDFVKIIGAGLHSHVLHVRICGKDYALKLFRYVSVNSWYGPLECYYPERDHREPLMALAPYSEPFYCECRAFGRLHETGRADLALDCFGYVLLNEENERALNNFASLDFSGDEYNYLLDARGEFCGPSGRPPPIRGIVKALGTPDNRIANLPVATARRLLDDIVQLHQLGIFRLDVRREQYVDWKLADFSCALTTPHFLTTPESSIPRVGLAAVEYQLFVMCIGDYWDFDEMMMESNLEFTDQRKPLNLFIIRGRRRYHLRHTARHRNVPYTLVDPRLFDWRAPVVAAKRTPTALLPRWYYQCSDEVAQYLHKVCMYPVVIDWAVRDGCIFPTKRGKGEVCHKLNMLLQKNGGEIDLTVPENKALVEEDKDARYMLDETYLPHC